MLIAACALVLALPPAAAQQPPQAQPAPPPENATPQAGSTRALRPLPQEDAAQADDQEAVQAPPAAPAAPQQAAEPKVAGDQPSQSLPVQSAPDDPARALRPTQALGQEQPPAVVQQPPAGDAVQQPVPGDGAAPVTPPAGPAPAVDAAVTRGILFRIIPPAPVQAEPALAAAETVAGIDTPGAPAMATEVRPSYLMATIHFGSPAEQGVDYATIEPYVREAAVFVNESDGAEAWQPDYDQYRWLAPETPLSGMIGREEFGVLRTLLPKTDDNTLERSKPWAILALLEARGERAGDDGMDARLEAMATGLGLHVVHLETLQAQLQALDCVPSDEQALVLKDRIRMPWILRIESAQALLHYRTRNLAGWLADIDRMEGLSERGRGIEHRARQCLIEQRNAAWIARLRKQLTQGGRFIAVGAIHLPGENGLIAALRREGYTVEALPL